MSTDSFLRKELLETFANPEGAVDTQVTRALELGAEYLDLPAGLVIHIEGGTQTITHAIGGQEQVQPGEACLLEETYCRRTVELYRPLLWRLSLRQEEVLIGPDLHLDPGPSAQRCRPVSRPLGAVRASGVTSCSH